MKLDCLVSRGKRERWRIRVFVCSSGIFHMKCMCVWFVSIGFNEDHSINGVFRRGSLGLLGKVGWVALCLACCTEIGHLGNVWKTDFSKCSNLVWMGSAKLCFFSDFMGNKLILRTLLCHSPTWCCECGTPSPSVAGGSIPGPAWSSAWAPHIPTMPNPFLHL